ncbi:uncharacterized protein LOC117638965 [Thrips palmi]|uniref:ubiquitinyl hydrolase 1 n=1 Tax=Thrips palmi TaxID=161013 RepID=A0A6P8Y271_THRPL|nr:uncharacterized protein LOC117638965 [Thrips palmi]XP_034230106.1 uncharacterized protein LOC117638965 [Thrips palmi]XP_034230107.1 uncharacterized protein LOC117638965 [Thrips palmi]XP_034230108.1 uncharacterized protein LOC117638965 [Thrips palmi]XP_034230109.1 uncharacterized protein LOC117638965 [Thrips palmi]
MVLENLWVDSGEVSETPVDVLPSSAPESMSLFGTPAYPPIGEGLSPSSHDRTSNKSKKEVSQTRVKSSDAYNYDEVDEEDGGGRSAHNGEDYRWNEGPDGNGQYYYSDMNARIQDVFRPSTFGPYNVDIKCSSSTSASQPTLPTTMPSAPPPPSPTFGDDGNGDLCLPLGLDTLLSNGDPLEDVKDSTADPGVCGLRNLGNTCFMSAGLQCLSNTPTLLHFFVNRPQLDKIPTESLTAQFSALLHRMWSGENRVVHPVDFKHALGVHFPQFQDYRQHDCQEFLALLLDSFHEQLNSAGQISPHNQDQSRSLDRFSNSSLSHSSESSGETQNTFRILPIPYCSPFRLAELSNGANANNQAINLSCKKEKNELVKQVNCTSNGSHLHGLQDILKDAKTSNVNVLVEEQESNSSIKFDSDKFPRHDIAKSKELVNQNLMESYEFDSKSVSVKRIKDTNRTNEQRDCENAESSGLDLKRIKLTEQNNCKKELICSALEGDESVEISVIESLKHPHNETQSGSSNGKSVAEYSSAGSSSSTHLTDAEDCVAMESFPDNGESSNSLSGSKLKEDVLADHHWEKHLSSNQSTIADTFLGQFKSTVVCSECKHVSVTYEPFMYLSVPLPHAMERQLCVTYVPLETEPVIKILLILNKQDKVRHLRDAIIDLRLKEGHVLDEGVTIVLAEVLDHHIAKFLDDAAPLRYVNDTNRTIYALEVIPPPAWYKTSKPTNECMELIDVPDPLEESDLPVLGCEPPPLVDSETGECLDDKLTADSAGVSDHEVTSSDDEDLADKSGSPPAGLPPNRPFEHHSTMRVDVVTDTYNGCDRGDDWKNCAICLEEMNKDMRRHVGCDCVLCEGCIENACKHHGSTDTMPCPTCNQIVKPNLEFVRIDKFISSKPALRLLNVPVVFRLDTGGDGNNNQKCLKLFGHPNVLKLPSIMPATELASIIKRLVHTDVNYSIVTVDGVGYHCSRCLYTKHCRGCAVASEGEVVLRSADTLAIRFTESIREPEVVNHPSMQDMRSHESLSLYDCLKAFSESELLDEQNPWFCPTCQKNQCATKTLSVWRYPDFLIVYLKRFVFHNGMSTKLDNKVTYPLNGLLVSATGSNQETPHVYNLYACVCHYGGVSAGHYTAYAKHPVNSEWHSFNDETVIHQKPQDEDYSNAYILFYQKQGVAFPELNLEEAMKPNIDHLIERLDSTMDQDMGQEMS